ncbi:hypothetical protein [Ferrimonas pelagia]|uniref:DUF4156 domain-containing protein n=1 Tax=Ferrimonas pelagia TaxID=1177826 RepID=A0ABP9FG75_9GAMM
MKQSIGMAIWAGLLGLTACTSTAPREYRFDGERELGGYQFRFSYPQSSVQSLTEAQGQMQMKELIQGELVRRQVCREGYELSEPESRGDQIVVKGRC